MVELSHLVVQRGPPHDLGWSDWNEQDFECLYMVLGRRSKIVFCWITARYFQREAPWNHAYWVTARIKLFEYRVSWAFLVEGSRIWGNWFSSARSSTSLFKVTQELWWNYFFKHRASRRWSKIVQCSWFKTKAPRVFIGPPISCANTVMSSMTFLGCSVPVQSSTTFR
jgi:hypothetical protein